MRDKDLLKLLKKNGWKLIRVTGSHHILKKEARFMLFVYPAVFHKEEDSYWVEFPDLPGCHSYGSSVTETMACAQEAMAGYILTLLEQERPIAVPSDMEMLSTEDGFTSLVSCSIDQYKETKAVKKTLTIPAWLNERAMAKGVNFSQVLQEALLAKVQG